MSIASNLEKINSELSDAKLVAVTKMRSIEELEELYGCGQRVFGENKVQEIVPKHEKLPKDIEWHLIGHLQSNKVKYIAPFIHTIHSIDSLKLLAEVNKQASKNHRKINCLLQIYIAKEESKFGLDETEAIQILQAEEVENMQNIKIVGLMGMATNTSNQMVVRNEFKNLKRFFDSVSTIKKSNIDLKHISMGMSGDYKIAIEEGSTLVRIGSAIFH